MDTFCETLNPLFRMTIWSLLNRACFAIADREKRETLALNRLQLALRVSKMEEHSGGRHESEDGRTVVYGVPRS